MSLISMATFNSPNSRIHVGDQGLGPITDRAVAEEEQQQASEQENTITLLQSELCSDDRRARKRAEQDDR